jgi:MoxR-like ATPase
MPETKNDAHALVAEIEALGGRLAEARAAIATRIIGQEEVVGSASRRCSRGGTRF